AGGGEQRRVQRGGGEERPRREHRTGFLEEQAQVDERARPELRPFAQVLPQRARRVRVVGVGADQRRRALLGEQRTGGVAQQLLLGREREVHVARSPCR